MIFQESVYLGGGFGASDNFSAMVVNHQDETKRAGAFENAQALVNFYWVQTGKALSGTRGALILYPNTGSAYVGISGGVLKMHLQTEYASANEGPGAVFGICPVDACLGMCVQEIIELHRRSGR